MKQLHRRFNWCLWLGFGLFFFSDLRGEKVPDEHYDIVVYGGTSGGIVAAIQAVRMGRSVIVIEPSSHLGGMTTGGLGATDIGNKQVIGGLSREFYRRIYRYYEAPERWLYEARDQYMRQRLTEEAMWTFEPSAASQVFDDWIREAGFKVILSDRLDLERGVVLLGNTIREIILESGVKIRGTMFIDATYEGDLMAKAGVTYHIGRESNEVYGETLNGLQRARSTKHQFTHRVDPFVIRGDPASGLLSGVTAAPQGVDGSGDHRVQAYCFRLCTTDVPDNRIPWPKPSDYDERAYELLLRNFEAGDHRIPWNPIFMPNRKTDTNNNFAISTDHIGANYGYADGNYAVRTAIWKDHLRYTQGLLWTLANHPRVPEAVRNQFQLLGLAKDEFTTSEHWPPQLYVREARRMISDYVMTEKNCLRQEVVDDSVGMGAYNMDSHNVQRYVDEFGNARNEGDIQVPSKPYPISYRSIRPPEERCRNLLVPVCLSASHIAYGSIRMEPVFMVLGQSAATAAAHAIEEQTAVQQIDYARLRDRLLRDGQVLDYVAP